MVATTIIRRDISRLDASSFTRTPAGLRIPAFLTRVGVLEYGDGQSTWGELKRPEEVFSSASLASLRGLPVTDLHPQEMVHPGNWQSLSMGHVADNVAADGAYVAADLVISAAPLIDAVERGDRVEISCGYAVTVLDAAGDWEGVPYQYVHSDIIYNHVALGPVDWGRAGSSVRLQDSKTIFQVPRAYITDSRKQDIKTMETFRLDGTKVTMGDKTYNLVTEADRASFLSALKEQKVPRTDALDPAAIQGIVDQLSGQLQGVLSMLAQLGQMVAQAVTPPETPEQAAAVLGPELVAQVADQRAKILVRANEIAADLVVESGWTNEKVMRESLAKAGFEDASKNDSAAYVSGVFSTVATPKRDQQNKIVIGETGDKGTEKTALEALAEARRTVFADSRKGL